MTLPQSDHDWIAGIAGDGIVTVGDPRLKRAPRLSWRTRRRWRSCCPP
jgi:hypothetical protein